jgi:hypothetical protein
MKTHAVRKPRTTPVAAIADAAGIDRNLAPPPASDPERKGHRVRPTGAQRGSDKAV